MSADVRVRHLPRFWCREHDGNGEVTTGGKDAMETGLALSEIDTTTPHPARMYNALLGGKDNFEADRVAAEQVLALVRGLRWSTSDSRERRAGPHPRSRTV